MNDSHPTHSEDLSNAAPQPDPAESADIPVNPDSSRPPLSPIDFVLLIDGDNDPHLPPDARVTRYTLARVFLRPGAKLPRNLEKALGRLPHFATVVSPKGGANAADFVMSLHAGMLHAVLPQSVPFLMVTNDATLQAMSAELQRLGRIASLWTSHPDAELMSAEARSDDEEAAPRSRSRRRGGRGRSRAGSSSASSSGSSRRGGRGRSSRTERAEAAPPPPPPVPDEPRKPGGKTIAEVAWSYNARLQRVKDPPSRVKTLLNDIKNRAGSHGFTPEEILEELKRHHGVAVDGSGRVKLERVKPAEASELSEEVSPS